MKENIDIEALLVWAYRAQCVDRVRKQIMRAIKPPKSYGTTWHGMAQIAEMGTVIQSTGVGLVACGANAPDDAFIVDAAVMALDRVYLEWQTETRLALWTKPGAAADGMDIEPVDHGVLKRWFLRAPNRSPRLLEELDVSVLVILHARDDHAPEWHEGWRAPRGRPASDKLAWDKRGRLRKQEKHEFSREQVVYDRGVYAVWHAALSLLAAQLEGKLARFAVTGPAAPTAPWLRDSVSGNSFKRQNSMHHKSL